MTKNKVEINIIFTLFFYDFLIILTLTFTTLKMIEYLRKELLLL